MYNDDAKSAIDAELARGEKARAEGFEGRARVCARRAAGIAVREFARMHQIPTAGSTAYELLAFIKKNSKFPPGVQQAAEHLLTRVDEEFKLPPDIDLLLEARFLAEKLLGGLF